MKNLVTLYLTWNTVCLNRFKRTSISCTIENEVAKKSVFPPQLYTRNIEQNKRQCKVLANVHIMLHAG